MLLMLAGHQKSEAQITLSNFNINNGNSVTITAGAPAVTVHYSVTASRTTNSNSSSYIYIYLIDGSNTPASTGLLFINPSGTNWISNANGNDYCTLEGNLNLDDNTISGGYYKKLRVIGQRTNNVSQTDASNDVSVVRFVPPVTNPPGGTYDPLIFPCGTSIIICDNQCVQYGTVPALLKGRELRDAGYPAEHEWAQWQYSYTNNWDDWHNIDGNATSRNFQPWACYSKVYYRRVSSHILYSFPTNHREEWYISNVVTIIPRSIPPTPVQSTVTACTQATAVTLAVNPVAPAVSYNWWVPYAGWGVSNDGLSPFSTYNQNASFVTTRTSVVITLPPGGVAPGTYRIAVSTNGACGGQTADANINVVISGTGAAAAPVSAQFVKASTSTLCAPIYNLKIPAVAGATSYSASDNYGHIATGIVQTITGIQSVLFALNLEGPLYGVTATASATGPCGTGFYTTPLTNLAGPSPKCDVMLRSTPLSLYPNPTSDKVTIVAGGQEAKAVFYDAMGVARKTVKLQPGVSDTEVSVQDLPAGIYHVQLLVSGQAPFDKQLIIQP